MTTKSGFASIVFCVVVVSSASAQGWKLPSPFKKKEPLPTVQRRMSDGPSEEKSAFRMPTFTLPKLPSFKRNEPPLPGRRTQPSTLTKFNRGAKAMFAKTKETLTPSWAKSKAPPKPPTRLSRYNTMPKPKEKKSLLSYLPFAYPKEEPRKKQTVGDFLRQQRPGFDR